MVINDSIWYRKNMQINSTVASNNKHHFEHMNFQVSEQTEGHFFTCLISPGVWLCQHSVINSRGEGKPLGGWSNSNKCPKNSSNQTNQN